MPPTALPRLSDISLGITFVLVFITGILVSDDTTTSSLGRTPSILMADSEGSWCATQDVEIGGLSTEDAGLATRVGLDHRAFDGGVVDAIYAVYDLQLTGSHWALETLRDSDATRVVCDGLTNGTRAVPVTTGKHRLMECTREGELASLTVDGITCANVRSNVPTFDGLELGMAPTRRWRSSFRATPLVEEDPWVRIAVDFHDNPTWSSTHPKP